MLKLGIYERIVIACFRFLAIRSQIIEIIIFCLAVSNKQHDYTEVKRGRLKSEGGSIAWGYLSIA